MERIRNLFDVRGVYENSVDQQRAQALLYVIALAGVVSILSSFITLSVISLASFVIYPVLFWMVRRGQLRLVSVAMVAFLLVIAGFVLSVLPGTDGRYMIVVFFPIVMATALFERNGILITGVLTTLLIAFFSLLQVQSGTAIGSYGALIQIALIMLLATGILAFFTGRQLEITTETIEEAAQLRGIIETNAQISDETSESDLVNRLIQYLRDTFRFDVVQVYVADEDGSLVRRVRSGMRTISETTMAGHFSVDTNSPVAEVARSQIPVYIERGVDGDRLTNYLIETAQSGLLVPVVQGGTTLGVIDIQNIDARRITQEERGRIDLIGQLVASPLAMVRYRDQMQQISSEQSAQVNLLQNQLVTLQGQREQLTSDVWGDYIESGGRSNIGFDLNNGAFVQADDLPTAMREALHRGEIYTQQMSDGAQVNIPILLRDEPLGVMAFRLPPGRKLNERQEEMARAISVRLASSLESVRLLEQTQSQAARERKATRVADQLISATSVDVLLKLAANAFNDTMGAVQTQIHLEPTGDTSAALNTRTRRLPNMNEINGINGNGANGKNGDHSA